MSSRSKKTVHTDSVSYDKSEPSSSIEWNEWSDLELNNETWDSPKSGEFVDHESVPMPSSLRPKDWKRFHKLDSVVSPIVFEKITDYPDFISNNKHLLHSEFMRCFVSTLINIQYCGRNGLEIENPSTNFAWNFSDQRWQGWFHVYSLNKAGKGVAHQPVVNPNGKYIVRIFFMGCWRRVFIDDTIPIDKRGRPLLPRTANVNELWPMILAKAILKVAAISWTNEREIVDCNFVTCLTGWIGLSLNVSHLSPRDQWEFLTKYAKHFEWPRDEKAASESAKSSVPEKATKSQKAKSTAKKKLQVPEEPRPTLLFLNLEDTRDVDAEEIPGITPCWNHQIYVELARDVPLDPAQVKPPLAKWKEHRWLDWAIRRGLVDASEYFVPIRHLLIVSPLREFNDDTSYSCDESADFTDEESSPTTLVSSKTKHRVKTASPAKTILLNGKSRDIDDISLWGDFNKLSLHLREVKLFYRKKFFKHSIEISNIVSRNFTAPNDGRKSKADQLSTRDGKKSAAKSVISVLPTGTYEYREKMLDSRNEALFLFVDSTEEKFFLVDLSTTARDTKKSSHLVVERHDWFHETGNELIAELTTRGTKSTVFKLEAGRHLLRIFISSESLYNVFILSDTAFHIGERLKMHGLMTTESMRIQVFAEKISNTVKKAFGSFGTESYGNYLRLYYQSYMPDDVDNADNYRKSLKSIHSYFRDEFAGLIKKRFSLEESKFIERSLRIFFLDPSIGVEISSSTYHKEEEDTGSRAIIVNSEIHRHRAAVLIQSAFRMFLVRHYKKHHDPLDKEHNRVKEALARVVELFDYGKHETIAGTLLRSTLKRDTIFKTLYKFSSDLINVIKIQELRGRVQKNPTRSDKWIPIARVVINAPKRESVSATLDLFANLSNYTLRVFANDTKREMPRLANNVAPARYRHREGGYTVFAYGWSDSQRQKDIEWTLHLTTIKGEPMFHWLAEDEPIPAISEIRPLLVQEISNTYVPNIRNRIAKISLRIGKTSLVSLMLRTSYGKALVRLRIIDEAGSALSEIEGVGVAILPVVFLEFENSTRRESEVSRRDEEDEKSRRSKRSLTRRSGGSSSHRSANASRRDSIEQTEESSNRKLYFVEASLREEDSWPLTEAEWSVVAEAKRGSFSSRTKSRKSSALGRISKTERPKSKQFSKKSLDVSEALLEPYWTLQIVTDAGNELEMDQDRSEETKIEELKKNWKTEESDRAERGRQLRGQFLEENSLVIAPSAIDMIDNETRTSGDDERKIMDSVVSLSNQILQETRRTVKPPADLGNYLPKLDLTIYMEREDEEENCWVKSEFDEETLRNQRAMNVLDFEQLQTNFIEEYADLVDHRRRKHRRLSQRCLENYNNRARAVEEAYEVRQAYIDSTKITARSVKSKGSKQKKTT